jgi:hypothetical protein
LPHEARILSYSIPRHAHCPAQWQMRFAGELQYISIIMMELGPPPNPWALRSVELSIRPWHCNGVSFTQPPPDALAVAFLPPAGAACFGCNEGGGAAQLPLPFWLMPFGHVLRTQLSPFAS